MRETSVKPERQHNLDWLRVLVILDLIPLHAAWMMTFVPGFSYVRQDTPIAIGFRYYIIFFGLWQMPLLFFISGIGTNCALAYRTAGEYIKERLYRLLIPLVFFMLFFSPLYTFFWPAVTIEKELNIYLFQHWPAVLSTLLYNERTGGPLWAHLWFVGYLLIFSLITLPLFQKLKTFRDHQTASADSQFSSSLWILFFPGMVFVTLLILLSPKWAMFINVNLYSDWAYLSYNLFAFILGFLLCDNESFWRAVDKHWVKSLVPAFLFAITLFSVFPVLEFASPAYSVRYAVYSLLFGLCTWLWIVGLLGFSRKFLSGSNAFLHYFNRASYPIYIIHFVVIVIIGYYLREWRLGILAEFALLSVFSTIVILAFYELVKRTKITRILFGIKG